MQRADQSLFNKMYRKLLDSRWCSLYKLFGGRHYPKSLTMPLVHRLIAWLPLLGNQTRDPVEFKPSSTSWDTQDYHSGFILWCLILKPPVVEWAMQADIKLLGESQQWGMRCTVQGMMQHLLYILLALLIQSYIAGFESCSCGDIL